MNFGHGEAGFGAWPRAKSMPVAEYCTVFSVSTPMALDALPMTALASWAEAVQASTTANPNAVRYFLNTCSPPFDVFSGPIVERPRRRVNAPENGDRPGRRALEGDKIR